jgi:cysteine desulfurase
MDVLLGPANESVYLDYNATTPIDPRVAAAAQPYLATEFGNPSSGHRYGATPARAVRTAREQVATLLGADREVIVFTGSGSEANNLAIRGAVPANRGRRPQVASTMWWRRSTV